MSCALLTLDLACSSQVTGAAARTAQPLEVVSTIEALAAAAARGATTILVDLNAPSLDLAELVRRVREVSNPSPRIIAFGPHVHEARLAAARGAGCDQVISRGQFYSQLDALLAQ